MRLRKPVPPGAPELRAIEACLQGEYGPWPHLWEDHEDILRAAAEAGLRREGSIDATRQTLPSYRITAPKRWLGLSARFGAGDVLRWLHETGRLTDLCARFFKTGASPGCARSLAIVVKSNDRGTVRLPALTILLSALPVTGALHSCLNATIRKRIALRAQGIRG